MAYVESAPDLAPSRGGSGARIGRRALVATAWTVPIITTVAAAPAFALSPVTCPPFPTTGYTETTSGTLNTAPRGFVGNAYRMNTDSNSATNTASVTATSPTINVTNGNQYTLSILIQTQYGVNVDGNGPAGTKNTNFTASVFGSIVGGTVTTATYSTQSSGGGTVVTPVNGSFSSGTTVTLSFTANATGTVRVRYAFVMSATNRGNDDDYQVTTSFSSCQG